MPDKSPYYYDQFVGFPGGVNTGVAPSLLPPDQLAYGVNQTSRGGYAQPRPTFSRVPLDFQGDATVQDRFENGIFQGGDFYLSDSGAGAIIAAIGGRLFRIGFTDQDVLVQEVTIQHATTTTLVFNAPAIGSVVNITVLSTANLSVGQTVTINGFHYLITSINSAIQFTAQNLDDPGGPHASGSIVQSYDLNPASRPIVWMQQAEKWMIIQDGQSVPIFFDGASSRRSNQVGTNPEISAGKMMAYWLGRLWWVNPDGRTFRAGDLVYSSSGSGDLRDAVLHQTQNTYLGNGGNFYVPANAGQITSLKPVPVLDNSLGQGPLQVSTSSMIFSCTASTDSTQWITTNDPVLGVSQFENGSLSHWSCVLLNGDMLYRASDGIRSLILGRKEFNVWGNVPQSREMNAIFDTDQQDLLNYSSAIVFDNRLLMTSGPVPSDRGVYHQGIVALDCDVISSMRGKLPPVYDGPWTGLRVLKLVKGRFGNKERAFAFSITLGGTIELFEISTTEDSALTDADNNPISWRIQTGDAFKKQGVGMGQKSRLENGEMFVDEIEGFVNFAIFFRPDQSTCWIPWNNFSVCAPTCDEVDSPYSCHTGTGQNPQFKNRLGFGQPPATCNPLTNSPYREGWTFQIKIEITGKCRLKTIRVAACKVDEPTFGPAECQGECEIPESFDSYEQQVCCEDPASILTNVSADFGTILEIRGACLVVKEGAFTSTVGRAEATQEAYLYVRRFFDDNIESGALTCIPPVELLWENCYGTWQDQNGDTQSSSICADFLPVVEFSETGATLNPSGLPFPVPCGDGDAGEYTFDLAATTQVIGPFGADVTISFSGTYQLSSYNSVITGCPGQCNLEVDAQVSVLGGAGSIFSPDFQASTMMTPDNVTGNWAITGILKAGDSLQFSLVSKSTNTVSDQPPVVMISLTDFDMTT